MITDIPDGQKAPGVRARCAGFGPLLVVVQDPLRDHGILDAGDHLVLAVGPLVLQYPLLNSQPILACCVAAWE